MALIDKASLLMVPSTYEDGTLYNVLPSGNKAPDETGNHNGYDQTRADFTFSRGSNLAATRVNASGLIEKGRENLLLQSNSFDTTWGNSNTTETSGQADKDGGTDAWLLTKSAGNGYLIQSLTPAGVQTASIYAKASDSDWIYLQAVGTSTASCYFDLVNGTTGDTGALIDKSIELIGNGWYRCSITYNQTLSNFRIYPAEANSLSASTGSIYIQDAQLELGLVSTPVIRTGATTATAGVLENTPRIDYSSGAGALLLESQRTNNILNSEYFGGYSFTNGSITTNNTTSPEGLNNASTFAESTATGTHQMRITTGVTIGSDVTFSFYAKANGRDYVNFWEDVTTGHQAYFNLSTGVATNNGFTSVGIEDAGNGWYRCYGTKSSFGGSSFGSRIHASQDANFNSYTGDGTSGFHIYGLQLESSASYPSSYVPTYGSAATRGADSCSVTGVSDILNDSEGTLFVEAETLENGADCRITISDNTIDNRVSIEWDANADTIKGFIGVGGNLETTNHDQTNRNKIAIVYNSSDARLFVNGSKIMTDYTVPSLSTMNRIDFSNYGAALPFVGKVYKMYISEEKLTDAEAVTLTT